MDVKELIKKNFPSFEPALAAELEKVAVLKSVQEGEILMRTGQNIKSSMLIVNGLIKIFREDEEGNEFFMYYLQPGEACAISLICAAKQETSRIMAIADAPTEVLAIPLENMDLWMSRYKTWYYFVLENYRRRFEELLVTIDHIAFRNMDERLVFYLKKYRDNHHTNQVKRSMTDIAQELNSSREVISRLMKKLADKGLVRVQRSYVELLDLNKAVS